MKCIARRCPPTVYPLRTYMLETMRARLTGDARHSAQGCDSESRECGFARRRGLCRSMDRLISSPPRTSCAAGRARVPLLSPREPSLNVSRPLLTPMRAVVKHDIPPGVRKLDQVLAAIVSSLDRTEHRDFVSSLCTLFSPGGGTATLAGSPAVSAASSPPASAATPPPGDALPARLDDGPLNFGPKLAANCFASVSSCTALKPLGPRLRLPPLLDLTLRPVSKENESRSRSPLSPASPALAAAQNAPAIRKQRRVSGVKHYADAQPSMHCHVCKIWPPAATTSCLLPCRFAARHWSDQVGRPHHARRV